MIGVRQKMEECINNLLKINGLERISQGSIRFKKLDSMSEEKEVTMEYPFDFQTENGVKYSIIIDETKDKK